MQLFATAVEESRRVGGQPSGAVDHLGQGGGGQDGGGFGFMTEKMRTLLEFPGEMFPDHFGVSRIAIDIGYGFAAVRRSLRNARPAGSANHLARHGFRGFLRLAAATPPIRRAMAAGLGA